MKIKLLYISLLGISLASCNTKKAVRLNEEASVSAQDELPENPLLLHAITSSVRPKDSTMSTLYGNDAAFDYASLHADGKYPNGTVLYEVTWRQQPDSQWFGANIPKKILTVERIRFQENNATDYTIYAGNPLKKTSESKNPNRISQIAAQRMAMVP